MVNGIRVLHVDDEPDFADLTATFLERENDRFQVTVATGVQEALNKLSEAEYDCIVSDFDMPGENGIDFLETVRKDHPGMPFILFTGKGSEEIASDAISAGVTDYLQKEGGSGQYSILSNRIINAVEHHRTERDLRESERRYRRLVEDAPTPIILYSAEGRVLYVNDAAVRLFNVDDRDALLDKHVGELAHPDSAAEVKSRFEKVAREQQSVPPTEQKVVSQDGAVRHVVVVSSPVTHEGETAVQTIAYDITERKEREEELQRKERRYRAIFQDPNILVGLLDADGSVREANETALNIIDADQESVKGEPFWETPWWAHSEELQSELRHWIEAAASGEYVTFEATHVTHDDERVVIDGRLRPVRDDSDSVVSIFATGIDVTERKRREEDLRLKDRAMDAAPVGILMTDPRQDDNPIVYTNDRFQELTGYNEEEILGRNCRFLQGAATKAEPVAEMRRAIDNKEPVTVELQNYRKDGSEFWNRVSIAPVRDEDGEVVRFVGFQQDITEWK